VDKDLLDDNQKTMVMPEENPNEATSILFNLDDVHEEMEMEFREKEEGATQSVPEEKSKAIKKHFSEKTEEEKLRVNRNFLKDAEPFRLETLTKQLKEIPEDLTMGLESLDSIIRIPQRAITMVTSQHKRTKNIFLQNMMTHLLEVYKDYHILYYSYEESKQDIESKLINIMGEQAFPEATAHYPNHMLWKKKLKTLELDTLLAKADTDFQYNGLKRFLAVSNRLHVIDSNYHISDLIDSIRSFFITLKIGAIFIDSVQRVSPKPNEYQFSLPMQMQKNVQFFRWLITRMKVPLIVGTQITKGEGFMPEYDILSIDSLKDMGNLDQEASLIIGLQDYSQSAYLGSNVIDHFSSQFYKGPLKQAEPMPLNLKTSPEKAIHLAKVLENIAGPTPEIEFIMDRQLLKLSDLTEKDIAAIQKAR
jgi:hypothetical protein